MQDSGMTGARELLDKVKAFAEQVNEDRRFQRRKLLWAVTIEVCDHRIEGMIVDFSPGGARIRLDGSLNGEQDLKLVLSHFGELGAKVIWQNKNEAGVQFLLAPEDVAERLKGRVSFGFRENKRATGVTRPK